VILYFMKYLILVFSFVVLLSGCSSVKQVGSKDGNSKVIWINSYKVQQNRNSDEYCFQYQDSAVFGYESWKNLPGQIDGFTYQPGNIYKLEVTGEPGSFVLSKVLESEPDMTLRINDIWILERMSGNDCVFEEGMNRPGLEIKVDQRRVNGRAHCNNYFGTITIDGEDGIRFGHIGSTKMACPELRKEQELFRNYDKVRTWKIENNRLFLSDENGTELLVFKKVD